MSRRVPNLVGKLVGVRWRDPNGDRVNLHETQLVQGWQALSYWWEVGFVINQIEGVMILAQSVAMDYDSQQPDEVCRAVIPLSLIEEIVVYQRARAPIWRRS